MGLFSSDYVTTVGTSVSRLVEDKRIPDSVKTGVLKALFQDGDTPSYIMEEVVASIGIRADRYYRYGRDKYVHGLPSGQRLSSTRGVDQVTAILSALHGSKASVEYCHFGVPNSLHIGWVKLVDVYGYNEDTNEIAALSQEKGSPVYLKDMVVVIPEESLKLRTLAALTPWGTPANAGYTPNRTFNGGALGGMTNASPINVDPALEVEHVRIDYTWQTIKTTTVNGAAVVTTTSFDASMIVSLVDYFDTGEYYHTKYVVNGDTKYWMYRVGSGDYADLDANFETQTTESGTYFPFAYFRYAKSSLIKDKTSEQYKTSKRLTKIIGLDYDAVAEAIDSNPDIKQVEQAMLIMAVPANTENEIEQRYLFDFFNNLYEDEESKASSPISAGIRLSQLSLFKQANVAPKSSIVIQDKKFKMALTNDGIYKKYVAGSIGAVDSYSSAMETYELEVPVQQFNGPSSIKIQKEKAHIYRHQLTEGLYEELRVNKLTMVYHIYGQYTATGDEADNILLVPLDRSITDKYSILDQEPLYTRSLHFVFNSRVVTEVKWYQQEWFSIFLIVIAVVWEISTGFSDGGQALALALGVSQVTLVLLLILIDMAIGLLVQLTLKLFVKVFGKDIATIAAIIAIIYVGYQGFNMGSLAKVPYAGDLIMLVNGLQSEILRSMYVDLKNEASDFSLFLEKQTALLDKAKDLLDDTVALNPFIIFGEKPNDYYNRTVHSGNIGILGLEAVSSYVDIALTLPTINDSLGGAV